MTASRYRLLNFAPMIDTELSRLVLRHYGVAYDEERHIFGWVSILALFRAGTIQVPILQGPRIRLAGPRAIVDRFDQTCPPSQMLVPAEQPLRTRIEADWDRFNGRLSVSTAAYAYYHLLPRRDLMREPFSRGIPGWEAWLLEHGFYGFLRMLLTLLLGLRPTTAEDAWSQIRAAFDHTDMLLADGRLFLEGDRLTLSDLALAAAAGPLLLPNGYGAPLPALDAMPAAMQVAIRECRARPSALLVQRVYDLVGG